MAGRHVGQEPERVLEVGKQPDVRIGKRRARAGLEMLHRTGRIATTDDVQPLLHIALVFEFRQHPSPRRLEKRIEIKLVELSAARDGQQFLRHLIGEQAHLRQCAIGIALAGLFGGEGLFSPLLVGVGPVENLLLDEFPRGKSPERRAG